MEHLASQVLFVNVLVNATGNVESPALELRVGAALSPAPFGVALKAASVAGTANVKLEYAPSEDEVNFGSYDDTTDIIASTLLERPDNAEGWNDYILTGVFNRFIKFKVTGVAANPTDTLVSAKLLFKEVL